MLFSSIPFLFVFLPITFVLYLISPHKVKSLILSIVSLFFYAWGEPRYVFLMLGTIAISYLLGLCIEHFSDASDKEGLSADTPRQKQKKRKLDNLFCLLCLILSIAVPLLLLCYYKYVEFAVNNLNSFFDWNLQPPTPKLPIGISFYTFQVISYTIDVYRGDVRAQKDPIKLAAYITMFPQLIAGPIVRYSEINEQLGAFQYDWNRTAIGIRRFILGLSKKVLLANQFGELCSKYQASNQPTVLFAWLYAISFTLQIYFDFSGYSDMAIGLGKILGFHFPENFNYPYIAGSITEFWRRWHISLGNWFRDYVYIPMGGNRVGRFRHIINILIVWFLTGLWHGASWNFVLWGLLYALLLTIEKSGLLRLLHRQKFLNHLYVLCFVTLGFVLFNASDLQQVLTDLQHLFGYGHIPLSSIESTFFLKNYAVLLLLGIIGSTPLPKMLAIHAFGSSKTHTIASILEPLFLILLLLLVTAYLVDSSFNPFLYFRF